jgi:hypothetical protein
MPAAQAGSPCSAACRPSASGAASSRTRTRPRSAHLAMRAPPPPQCDCQEAGGSEMEGGARGRATLCTRPALTGLGPLCRPGIASQLGAAGKSAQSAGAACCRHSGRWRRWQAAGHGAQQALGFIPDGGPWQQSCCSCCRDKSWAPACTASLMGQGARALHGLLLRSMLSHGRERQGGPAEGAGMVALHIDLQVMRRRPCCVPGPITEPPPMQPGADGGPAG